MLDDDAHLLEKEMMNPPSSSDDPDVEVALGLWDVTTRSRFVANDAQSDAASSLSFRSGDVGTEATIRAKGHKVRFA